MPLEGVFGDGVPVEIDQERGTLGGVQPHPGPAVEVAAGVGGGGQVGDGEAEDLRRCQPVLHQRAVQLLLAGHERLAVEPQANLGQAAAGGLTGEGLVEVLAHGETGVDLVGGVMVDEPDGDVGHPRDRPDRRLGVGSHDVGEVGGAEVRRQPEGDGDLPAVDPDLLDEPQIGDGLVEFGVADGGQRLCDPVLGDHPAG